MTHGGVRWHGLVSFIHLAWAEDGSTPGVQVVFEDPFMKLMENVGRDTDVDVGMREFSPEWLPRVLKVELLEGRLGAWSTFDVFADDAKGGLLVSKFGVVCLATSVMLNIASRAATLATASDHTLLGVVGHVHREDREDLPVEAVRADHLNTVLSCLDNGFHHVCHAVVEDIVDLGVAGVFAGEALREAGCREISEQDGCSLRDGSAGDFGDVADGEVNRPCSFIATEVGKLGFVAGEDKGGDGCVVGKRVLLQHVSATEPK